MAKKTKDTKASDKNTAKAPADPAKTRNLLRLLKSLALILAITAFLLQLFAVLTHHWKWQVTNLRPLLTPGYHYAQPNVYNDSRLDQNYGLYSRDVKLYAHNDEELGVWASTRFPRLDDGEPNLRHCLSQTSTLRGAFLTCAKRLFSSEQCHCRRYAYWNFVIFFEVAALILLGIVVFLTALLSTQFKELLKPAAAGLALLAFIFLLVGLILILSHLKRETRFLADAYPHIRRRLGDRLGIGHDLRHNQQRNSYSHHRAVRQETSDIYRLYPLSDGQHRYNNTHFQQYSEHERAWVYIPYSRIGPAATFVAPARQRVRPNALSARRDTTVRPVAHTEYDPVIGYNDVFDHTRAGIGWSTILSILAMIPALLLPLILIFSWLTAKKLGPDTTTTVTRTVKTEYVPLATDIPHEGIGTRTIPTDYNPQRPIGEAVVTARNVPSSPYDAYGARTDPVIVRDVVIRDDQPGAYINQERSGPVNMGTSQATYRN